MADFPKRLNPNAVFVTSIALLTVGACAGWHSATSATSVVQGGEAFTFTPVAVWDCSGHQAGYAWAEDNGISDPLDCGGNSSSFYEGCVAFAEDYCARWRRGICGRY